MNLLEMSFSGGVLILVIIVLRALVLNRLPKGMFLALWAVAALRLLLPFSISSPVSVYTLAEPVMETLTDRPLTPQAATTVPAPSAEVYIPSIPSAVPTAASASQATVAADLCSLIWLAGMAVCGAFFLTAYLRCRKEFRTALPVENDRLLAWLADQRLWRTVSLRQSSQVDAPLTYGLLHPVILLPKGWESEPRLNYVLGHELTHIRHLDALWKLVLAATACVHWFNPLVWCMYVLANRDIELRCDEVVVRWLGLDNRSGYALALISLEEKKSGLGPFASAFNRNAIEERIIAIMKLKKRSIAAILAAVVLVCCVGMAFATSAVEKTPYPKAPDGTFTEEELNRLSELWFKDYGNMTAAAYRQKLWAEFDTPEDVALMDRYGQNSAGGSLFNHPEVILPEQAFSDYFFNVCEPLMSHNWQARTFLGMEAARIDDTHVAIAEYTYTLRILDAETLTVSEYEQASADVKAGIKAMLYADPAEADLDALSLRLSTEKLAITVEGRIMWNDNLGNITGQTGIWDEDAALHAQSSKESSDNWDRLLSPYAPFGLTWKFDDPDLDGNGLTMWFEGKEVRSITDTQEGVWITEHTGDSYPDGAVDLYVVYTDGVLSGLRFATEEEQEVFDKLRQGNGIYVESFGKPETEEAREFPRATPEDYDAFLTLRTVDIADLPEWASYPYPDARDLPLEDFNQRLLDWANENSDAWDRINCDVLWNDFDKELTTDAKTFVSVTCYFSGIENGQMVRALHTGNPEQDPSFSRSLPERVIEDANGYTTSWCDLYYDISYHIADKSAVTVWERDACVGGMMNAINTFWQDTDLDTLLSITEADVVAEFNRLAAEASTEGVKINPITEDDIHFESYDERGID